MERLAVENSRLLFGAVSGPGLHSPAEQRSCLRQTVTQVKEVLPQLRRLLGHGSPAINRKHHRRKA